MDYEQEIVALLNEIGVSFDIEKDRNTDLRECIDDSMAFISFVVALEEKFDFEFPDELLGYDNNLTIEVISEAIKNK